MEELYRYRATLAHHTAAISSDVGRPGIEKPVALSG
jgi:hypothetical protein